MDIVFVFRSSWPHGRMFSYLAFAFFVVRLVTYGHCICVSFKLTTWTDVLLLSFCSFAHFLIFLSHRNHYFLCPTSVVIDIDHRWLRNYLSRTSGSISGQIPNVPRLDLIQWQNHTHFKFELVTATSGSLRTFRIQLIDHVAAVLRTFSLGAHVVPNYRPVDFNIVLQLNTNQSTWCVRVRLQWKL